MNGLELVLSNEERAVFALRGLYKQFGYAQYKMSKFEEYDLYAKNKNFLVSDNVITFTDTDGKLLALKPDVTLSIIKNDKDGEGLKKLFYNEHVYRVSKGTQSFKEIMQVGLECLGDVDEYTVSEVIYLASKSLDYFSSNNVLDLSHLGLVNSLIEYANFSEDQTTTFVNYLAQKNAEGVKALCREQGIDQEKAQLLVKLVTLYGNCEEVIPMLSEFEISAGAKEAINNLKAVVNGVKALGGTEKLNIDFSVINDVKYYNGVVFKGFVSGIPTGILSGGQYDNLMTKMGKKSRAIGFAVYLDDVERLNEGQGDDKIDVAIEYDKNTPVEEIAKQVSAAVKGGNCVVAEQKLSNTERYKKIIKL